MLRVGDTFQLPIVRPTGVELHALTVEEVRQGSGGRLYCFGDDRGPIICIREARLARLLERARAAQALLPSPPSPATH